MPHARYETDGDVAEIVISNPPLNLWGPPLISDIEDGVARAAAERPRALIVRAEGDVFSAGVDVHVFEGLDAPSADALTGRLLRSYMAHPTYYRLSDHLKSNGEIDNPDQRIAEDVRAFTATTLSFVLLILNGTLTVLAFSGVLWQISPLLFGVAILYAGVGSLLTVAFGYRLVGLNYAQLDREADFRADLVQVGSNAESLALSRDGKILATWGKQGLGPGEFDWVHGVVVDSKGAVYAADTYGQRLQKFVPSGTSTQ